jgi:hypothetical protein
VYAGVVEAARMPSATMPRRILPRWDIMGGLVWGSETWVRLRRLPSTWRRYNINRFGIRGNGYQGKRPSVTEGS